MNPHRLFGLQALRGVAAVMVLIGHVLAEAEHYFALQLSGDAVPWTRGVDIFFVITLSASRYAGQPGAFRWRRVLRVVPLYYLFTTLMVAALLVLPNGAKDTTLDPAQILSSYGFFPYADSDGRISPVLSLGWTLNYEIFFYALMALCLALPRPLVKVAGMLMALALLGLVVDFTTPPLAVWTIPLILEFLFGIALARLWQRGWSRPDVGLSIGALLLGFALLVALDLTPLPRFIAAGLPAAMIVAGGTLFCPLRPLPDRLLGPGQLLGDASYALYLSHRFALRAATLVVLPLLPATAFGAWVYVVTVCALAVAVSIPTHIAVERPLMRGFGRRKRVAPA